MILSIVVQQSTNKMERREKEKRWTRKRTKRRE
jgi:hypothetical protein